MSHLRVLRRQLSMAQMQLVANGRDRATAAWRPPRRRPAWHPPTCEGMSSSPEPMQYLPFLLAFVAISWYVGHDAHQLFRQGRDAATLRRRGAALWALVVCLCLPWTTPAETRWLRIISTGYAIIFALQIWELHRDRIRDRRLFATPLGFLLWWLIPLDARRVEQAGARRAVRRQGHWRMCRAAAKLGATLGLFALHNEYTGHFANPWLFSAWSMAGLYCYLSGVADALTGAGMQAGLAIDEPFESPWLSRNPAEFWGKRWNVFVTNFARRHVFWPIGGLRRPTRATMAIFIGSGLAHEYIVICCRPGLSPYLGYTLAFFTIHGLAVIAQGYLAKLRRQDRRTAARAWPRGLCVGLHVAWMWLTSPLFFLPLNDALGYGEWF